MILIYKNFFVCSYYDRFNSGYTEVQTYVGHKNFVTCVCAIPPSDIFPNGLIVTGGNDNIILLFQPECSTSFQQLSGHKNTGILYFCK